MLVEFTVSNFRSIHEPQSWSMVASPALKEWEDRNTFPALGAKKEMHLGCVRAALYGPNAAGKSTLVQALAFVKGQVVNSARESQQGDLFSGGSLQAHRSVASGRLRVFRAVHRGWRALRIRLSLQHLAPPRNGCMHIPRQGRKSGFIGCMTHKLAKIPMRRFQPTFWVASSAMSGPRKPGPTPCFCRVACKATTNN